MTDISVGDIVAAARINDKAGTIIAYGERPTASSGFTTTETAILRLDGIPVISGRQYEITMTPTVVGSTVANDLIETPFRVAIGATATTTSTHIGSIVETANSAGGAQRVTGGTFLYTPGSTGNLSLLVSGLRTGGSGTCTLGSSTSAYMMRIIVKDLGLAVPDTGVDL